MYKKEGVRPFFGANSYIIPNFYAEKFGQFKKKQYFCAR